ncbi:HAD-IIIC family phosphatase [Aggregicoccus sp. 17bor-14]|uniref:HAD-IIIC family phosphatase n=1 Tax=Myxococcaceae TaxID=31 RepID=UPI00129C822D|nr:MULTISPECIES: HAD-IIIC family phosphatase [Myxococcaceae]MBF5042607.1 HAD-IIIC family phosphatase [Simulacricoccus sp. 17bor-14]MRI88375.1 HAD-IIIC family phosphatase [Aggregicoccus sp. 17bor-14]
MNVKGIAEALLPRSPLVDKLLRSLGRDAELPLSQKVSKGVRFLTASTSAPFYLRECTQVGARARTQGRPVIVNQGELHIGDDLNLNCAFSPVQLSTAPGGVLEIGNRADINFGTLLSAHARVSVGDRARIGPYCILSDTGTADASPSADAPLPAQPISVGHDVWLAGRVTVLPGASIGDGSVITAGSVVSGAIPAGVIAGGIPARVLRRLEAGAPAGAAELTGPTEVTGPTGPTGPSAGARLAAAAQRLPAASEAADAVRPAVALRGLAISDFTIDELAQQLEQDLEAPGLALEVAPFGQVMPTLMELGSGARSAPDFALVWTRPEAVLPSFAELLAFKPVAPERLLEEVDAFCALLTQGVKGCRFAFVPTWVLPAHNRGLGLLDTREGPGLRHALTRANLRLMENLARASNVHVLDAERWVQAVGRNALNPKLWYLGKVAFHSDVFAEAVKDLKAAVRGLTGGARKLVVVDLDDTLWGGIVGDQGWQNLRLGGHDSVGESFVDFQHHLKALTRRGIVLAIASKNEESVALEAIRSHPEMVLKPEDFVGWRINWQDKARNIADLAAELNLGLQSVVFLDDNPVERARVREALPEVLVPEWPEDKLLYTSALLSLRCFDAPAISKEDLERTQMYGSERQRDALKEQVGSLDAWLQSLGIQVKAEPLSASNLQRSTQLLNKTNQMNLSTRRLTEPELQAWASAPGHRLWAVHVSDRFGDAGLTGLVSVEVEGTRARVVDFVLSCRVMGRKVEETMAALVVAYARTQGLSEVVADFLPTKKNKPCLTFWEGSGFTREGERFRWDASAPYPVPGFIQLEEAP